MIEQNSQKSCWGVAAWTVAIFIGVFAVFSVLNVVEPANEKIASFEAK